ncbi:MAG: BamA/TamA family outer membrane protein [Candidatus Marinimicrobia bacterium]|nr:BamA/TamA family outer membrane protein [Candidatus Neomarinimicrobiota bacterium]MCF7880219.1 BamA/TamA family outer membrane protein [Candidatus Neomarinimicrobiota bacterium]
MSRIGVLSITRDRENFVRYFKLLLPVIMVLGTTLLAQSRPVEFYGLPEQVTVRDSTVLRFSDLSDYVTVAMPRLLQAMEQEGYLSSKVDSIVIPADKASSIEVFIESGEQINRLYTTGRPDSTEERTPEFRLSGELTTPPQIWEVRIKSQIADYADRGFPIAKWAARGITAEDGDITVSGVIDPGSKIILDTMVVRNSGETQDRIFLREMRIPPGTPYSRTDIRAAQRRLRQFDFVESIASPKLFRSIDGDYGLLWEIRERRANTFNGILGYVPATQSQQGFFTGQLQFDFVNLFGTARQLNIFWDKQNVITQEMAVSYTEPWIAGYPLNGTAGFRQLVQDSSYIRRHTTLVLDYQLNWLWNVFGEVTATEVISTPSGRALSGIRSYRRYDYTAGVEFSTLDDPRNPRSGVFFSNSIAQRNGISGIQDPLRTIDFEFQAVRTVNGPHVLSGKLTTHNIVDPPSSVPVPELYRFGGASSVRGYDESAFLGTAVGWVNLEYRLLFEKGSRIVTFYDYGYRERFIGRRKSSQSMDSFGFGLRLQTAVGQLGIDYGIPRDGGWQNGRIHVRFFNYF